MWTCCFPCILHLEILIYYVDALRVFLFLRNYDPLKVTVVLCKDLVS